MTVFIVYQEIGCLVGAISNLWIGDRLGRRKTIVLGGIIMIIGAILQTASFGYPQMIVARIVTGLGNGLNVSGSICLRTFLNGHPRLRRSLPTMQNALPPRTEEV